MDLMSIMVGCDILVAPKMRRTKDGPPYQQPETSLRGCVTRFAVAGSDGARVVLLRCGDGWKLEKTGSR